MAQPSNVSSCMDNLTMIQYSNVSSCTGNLTKEEFRVPGINEILLGSLFIIADIVFVAQNIVILHAVRKLVSISKACRWIWYNELVVEIGIYLFALGIDTAAFFLEVEFSNVELTMMIIYMYTCLSMSLHMLTANMYNIYLAFHLTYDYSSISEKKIRIFLLASWCLNFLISCMVLFDNSLLVPHPTSMVDFKLTKSNVWIVLIQIANLVIYPTVCIVYSFIQIKKLQTCNRALSNAVQGGFRAGYKLAWLLFRFYMIQIISLLPYIILVYFGHTLRNYDIGVQWHGVQSVFMVIANLAPIFKLPIFVLRNKELKKMLKCNSCNTVVPA